MRPLLCSPAQATLPRSHLWDAAKALPREVCPRGPCKVLGEWADVVSWGLAAPGDCTASRPAGMALWQEAVG